MSETHDINELDKKYVEEKSSNEFAEMLEQDSDREYPAPSRKSTTLRPLWISVVEVRP